MKALLWLSTLAHITGHEEAFVLSRARYNCIYVHGYFDKPAAQ